MALAENPILTGLIRPYAKAVMSCAEQLGDDASQQWSMLLDITQQLLENEEFCYSLEKPGLSNQQRKIFVVDGVKAVLAKTEFKISDKVTQEFEALLAVMTENKRLGVLAHLANAYKTLLDASKSVRKVTIQSAFELNDTIKKQVENSVKKSLGVEKSLEFIYELNPKVSGGLIAKSADWVMDASLDSMMDKFKRLMIA